MPRTEYLVDLLPSAAVEAPGDNYADLQRITIGREAETAVFQHPTSAILFPPLQLGERPTLDFGCGVKEFAWERMESEVRFVVSVLAGAQQRVEIFRTELYPRARREDRAWQRHSLDLSSFAGRVVQLIFETSVPKRRSNKFAWAGWANPRLTDTASAPPRTTARRDTHPHVFLITADALPARYLECYGNTRVQTPHLKQLAADGVLFEEAWSQSCMTMGSYASLLTGRHTFEHGVGKEWEPFPAHQLSLPVALAGHGYHTLFAPGSLELSERGVALRHIFAETLPTLANPMQDGAVTTRRFARWLEERPDKPCFCWLHYFDTHPPGMPPAPFRSMYYAGDPTDQNSRHLAEQVAKIRGVESALVIRAAWPLLEKGEPVYEVREILEDTAEVLQGRRELKPDLAEHVLRLGPPAMNGLPAPRFGQWLSEQADEMARGRTPDKLLAWLRVVLRMLEGVEEDLISWLRGVVDFRFPLGMYMGTVSYFDAQVGALAASLRELGIYDQSLIVVAAPHGEVLESPTLPYHHFMLAPETLRVPLIIKPPARSGAKTGVRLGGVFDLIDLFPTLLDMQGLKHSFDFSGTSRWESIHRGEDIPPHDSFATGFHGVAYSVYRPPHLLVKERAGASAPTLHTLLSGGDEVVYDAASLRAHSAEEIAEAESLRAALDAWRRRFTDPARA